MSVSFEVAEVGTMDGTIPLARVLLNANIHLLLPPDSGHSVASCPMLLLP